VTDRTATNGCNREKKRKVQKSTRQESTDEWSKQDKTHQTKKKEKKKRSGSKTKPNLCEVRKRRSNEWA